MNTQINQSNQHITAKEEPDYRQLYEELQVQQQFTLSHVSHEIRNPVTLNQQLFTTAGVSSSRIKRR